MLEKEKYRLIVKFSEFYTTEIVDSLIHLYGRGNHHDRINDNVLATGTANVEDNHLALYLGYYEYSISC